MPHLVCVPYAVGSEQPTEFWVTIDSCTPSTSAIQTLGDGSVRLYYDLIGTRVGVTHTASVIAVQDDPIYGEEQSSPGTGSFMVNYPHANMVAKQIVIGGPKFRTIHPKR